MSLTRLSPPLIRLVPSFVAGKEWFVAAGVCKLLQRTPMPSAYAAAFDALSWTWT